MIKDPNATQQKINPAPSLLPDVSRLKKNAAQAGANLFSDTRKNTRDYGKPKFFEGGGAVEEEEQSQARRAKRIAEQNAAIEARFGGAGAAPKTGAMFEAEAQDKAAIGQGLSNYGY